MKRLVYPLLAAGAMVFAALIAWQGVAAVFGPLLEANWRLAAVIGFYLAPLGLAAQAWRSLLPPTAVDAPLFRRFVRLTWIGLAVNWVLPVAQVGGDFIRARLLQKAGVDAALAGASVVVDKTLQAATQAFYCLIGLALLAGYAGSEDLIGGALLSTLVLLALIGVFFLVQRAGLFRRLLAPMARLAPFGNGPALAASAEALDRAVLALYRNRRRLGASFAYRMLFRFVLLGEVWIALGVLGYPVGLVEALIIESLIQAVRGAAFAVPGALGVQEGGLVLIGVILGLPAEAALALSLVKRVREAAIGVPGVLAWQWAEGRLWRGHGRAQSEPTR
jgi:putative membrane protein